MSIDASGTKYWTGRGGVVLVNDPIETIEQVARAYDIRWLVLDREDGVDADRSDPRRRGEAGLAGRTGPRRRRSARLAVFPVETGAVSRREAACPRCCIFVVALVVAGLSSPPRSSSPSRRTPPTTSAWRATCSRAAAWCQRRAVELPARRRSIFPRPAFEVWMPLPTFLAAIPMALFGPTFAAAQVSSVLVGAIVPVLAWRLAAGRRRGARTRPRNARAGVGDRDGPDVRRLPAAAAQLGPARLDDAVRGARARRCLLMTRIVARPARRRAGGPAPDRARGRCSASGR